MRKVWERSPGKGAQAMNINELAKEVHENAVNHGWWEKPPSLPEALCLIHAEREKSRSPGAKPALATLRTESEAGYGSYRKNVPGGIRPFPRVSERKSLSRTRNERRLRPLSCPRLSRNTETGALSSTGRVRSRRTIAILPSLVRTWATLTPEGKRPEPASRRGSRSSWPT